MNEEDEEDMLIRELTTISEERTPPANRNSLKM